MRRITLLGSLIALVAAVFFLWQFRFERLPGSPTYRLADLRSRAALGPGAGWIGSDNDPKLRLRVDPTNSRIVARLGFPEISAADFMHVRFQVSGKHLRPARELWEDGRCIIEWHPQAGGETWENDEFTSVQHDQDSGVTECVLRPDQTPAVPTLRLENLGSTGEMEVSRFEATVLRERMVWKIGRWFVMAGWILWVAVWIGPVGKRRFIRPVLAGVVCLLMGLYFVVPGPWKILHSFGEPFRIGPEIKNVGLGPSPPKIASASSANPSASSSPSLAPAGKIPDKGDFTLRLKQYAANARPFLHSLLLFGPALLISFLVGWKKAVPLMVILSLAIEGAQFSFGYGFDWQDVFDLFNDAVGITMAVLAYRRLMAIQSPKLAAWFDSVTERALPLQQ